MKKIEYFFIILLKTTQEYINLERLQKEDEAPIMTKIGSIHHSIWIETWIQNIILIKK